MSIIRKTALAAFSLVMWSAAFAQVSPAPHIAYVYPSGGQRGSSFTVMIGGSEFEGVDKVIFTAKGVDGKISEITVPFTQGQRASLILKLEKEYILEHPEIKNEVLKLGKTTVYDLIGSGEIPHMKIRNRIRVTEDDLAAYIEKMR